MENNEKSSEKQYDELFEDDEDEKMEKFYELIRRFKEARDIHQRSRFLNHNQRHHQAINHNHNHNNHDNHNSTRKKEEDVANNKAMAVGSDGITWMPSFRWEDFRDLNHDHQVAAVSDKSATPINFFKNHSSNFVHTYDINKFDKNFKKRKISDVADEDEDEDEDEITTATQSNNESSHPQFDTGLDLNLAL